MKKLLLFVLLCVVGCSEKNSVDPIDPELQRIQSLVIGNWVFENGCTSVILDQLAAYELNFKSASNAQYLSQRCSTLGNITSLTVNWPEKCKDCDKYNSGTRSVVDLYRFSFGSISGFFIVSITGNKMVLIPYDDFRPDSIGIRFYPEYTLIKK